MNWLKRAYYSTTRCWVRTVILVLIFSVIAALLFCGISIRDASQRMVQQAKSMVGSEVTVAWNLKRATTQSHFTPVRMTEKQLQLLAEHPNVKDYNLITNFFAIAVADGFSPMGDKSLTLDHQEKEKDLFISEGKSDLAKGFQFVDMVVYGARKSELCDQFVSGGYKLVSGRPLTEADYGKDVVLITKQLADKNRLKLGDTIHFNTCFKKTHYPFRIVGIFTTPAPKDDTIAQASENTPYNHVFVPFTQSGYFDEDQYKPYTLNDVMTANFYLKDPGKVASFTNYAKKLLGDEYIEESNDDLYQTVVRPLAGVVAASDLLSIFTFAAGGIIFTLVIVFTVRGRRHEFGVLLAVGEKRTRLLGQIFLETFLPVCVAACIGVAAGSGICGIIGNSMLSQKAAIVQEQQNEKAVMGMVGDFLDGLMGKSTVASPISKIDMSVSARELGQLAAACLALTAVSVSVPCIWVARCRPREILQQK